ncbi:MAG: hypothetical protein ACRC33_01865 [Gemmataceae bacterium]
MASMAIWSRFTGNERVIAVAVNDGGRGRVYVRSLPRPGRTGELVIRPFQVAELADACLDGRAVMAQVGEDVSWGLADLRLEVLGGGGKAVTKRVWVEVSGDHPPLAFGTSLKELTWDAACPLGTAEAVYARLMGSAGPTAFAIPKLPVISR